MSEAHPDPQSFLPLSQAMFHILLALGEEELHGYGITRTVQEHTDGKLRLGAGALYDTLKRLVADGLVVERSQPLPSDRERRRYYRLTQLGRQVVAAEAERLQGLIEIARAKHLFPGTEGGYESQAGSHA